MEKYDYIVKSSEIRKLVEKRMYQKALKIMDTMDVNKVKVLSDLSIFAEVYIQTGYYDEAEKILLRLRDKSGSRRIIYQLIKLAIKRKNVEDAEYYYNEFVEVAPRDADKFILRYRLDKMEGKDYPALIESLRELKQYDYTEKWAFELAKLYHKAGMPDRCVNECSDIILWFGDGMVVEKAKMLREHYMGSESGIPEGVPLRNLENGIDFLEQEELELQDEEDREVEVSTYQIDPQPEGDNHKEEENDQDNLFKTQDLRNISQMLESYVDEEKQTLEETPIQEEKTDDSGGMEEDTVNDQVHLNSYKELFGRFYNISSIRLQVVNLINDMLKEQTPYSFAVAGTSKSGKTTLAKCIIKILYELQVFPYKKVAKISIERLNDINLEDHYERLQGGYLIVEKAGGLQAENQLQLIKMLRDLRGNMLIILEDTQDHLQSLFRSYPMLTNYVKDTIKMEAYGKKELYEYAVDFLSEKEFQIEEDADDILHVMCERLENSELAEDRPKKLLEELNKTLENMEQRCLQEATNEEGRKNVDNSSINMILASDFSNE